MMHLEISKIFSRLIPHKLHSLFIFTYVAQLIIIVVCISALFLFYFSKTLENQMGQRALQVSKTLSFIPEIKHLLKKEDPNLEIQQLAQRIRTQVGASFIVVGDKKGRRYSHPVPERLGKTMVGGDNVKALVGGEYYISKAKGTLGYSIRGKSPIFDNGEIIGIVSVGYLLTSIEDLFFQHALIIISLAMLILFIGIALSMLASSYLKKKLLNLEPDEISQLYLERQIIIESVREGVIAIDKNARISLINQAAYEYLGLNLEANYIGLYIREILPQSQMPEVLKDGKAQLDQLFVNHNELLVINRIPIKLADKTIGVVSSFRPKDHFEKMMNEFSYLKDYAKTLRVQAHEYSNKLHTIAGLIQLQEYEQASDLIQKETSGLQKVIHFLIEAVPNPVLSGLILGKYNQAKELKINFTIDPESTLKVLPENIDYDKVVTILGNFIDNAFTAAKQNLAQPPQVFMSMTDLGNDVVFEIEDSGQGISESEFHSIFNLDYTTSDTEGRGVGLYLAKKALVELNGHVSFERSKLGGTAFSIFIPYRD